MQIDSALKTFCGENLTETLSEIENSIHGLTSSDAAAFISKAGAGKDVLAAAASLKRLAGQINVTIHALGILLCLPHLLEEKEVVEYVSLGAGNTGRQFDLETNFRVAEFKFIKWRGGPESIRQNSIFKDFFLMAKHETSKRKYLYLLDVDHPMKFFKGGRSLQSILSKNDKVKNLFFNEFGNKYAKVCEYFDDYRQEVIIQDVSPWLSALAENLVAEDE